METAARAVMRTSAKAQALTESVIREMTRLALANDAINLAQGFPDFAAPDVVKRAACAAIEADVNQYSITWGAAPLRQALAEKYRSVYGLQVDPDRQICVTCGATEAMAAAVIGIADPGDEVVVLEPFYENYGADAIIAGAVPRYVTLHEPDWTFDEAELAAAFTDRTRLIILNNPGNPTGKVFTRDELAAIARLCEKFGVIAISDEIYEHIIYDGAQHIPIACVPGMEDRSVIISALSKTYSVTGWRVGWTIAPPEVTTAIRRVHDFLTVGAPAPLQQAGAAALQLPASYYQRLAADYAERRGLMLGILEQAGLRPVWPSGAYYTMTDSSVLGLGDDVAAARALVTGARVAAVPGSSFYSRPELGAGRLRFSFCKRLDTLREAGARLASWRTQDQAGAGSGPGYTGGGNDQGPEGRHLPGGAPGQAVGA
jgi:aspartate/methionine/tyrosine aminotransferase